MNLFAELLQVLVELMRLVALLFVFFSWPHGLSFFFISYGRVSHCYFDYVLMVGNNENPPHLRLAHRFNPLRP